MIKDFKGTHILHGNQFSKEDLDRVMQVADEFEKGLDSGKTYDLMKGKVLAALFFEPSTRTRLSFESAMLRLGGGVISVFLPQILQQAGIAAVTITLAVLLAVFCAVGLKLADKPR